MKPIIRLVTNIFKHLELGKIFNFGQNSKEGIIQQKFPDVNVSTQILPTSVRFGESSIMGGGGPNSNAEAKSKFNSLFKKPPPKPTKVKQSKSSKNKLNVCESSLGDIRNWLPVRGEQSELEDVWDIVDRI